MQTSTRTKIWLHGDPVFSLAYTDPDTDKVIHTDLSWYRPSPIKDLYKGYKYIAYIDFAIETLAPGITIKVPRIIKIYGLFSKPEFIYIL